MPVIVEEEEPCSTNMSKENVIVTSEATNGDSHSNGDDAIGKAYVYIILHNLMSMIMRNYSDE